MTNNGILESPQDLLTDIFADINRHLTTKTATIAFKEYVDELDYLVAPYIRNGFLDEKAKSRYVSETATLFLVLSFVSSWYEVSGLGTLAGFLEKNQEARFFSWYKLSPKLETRINNYAESVYEFNPAHQLVALIAENSLAGLRRRSLGEFFTPSSIADHLLDLANFDPKSILSKKVCDPACGSGNLLTSVLSQIGGFVSSGELDAHDAIEAINKNLYGIDVQPIAVLLTRLQLLVASIPIIKKAKPSSADIVDLLPFENIILCDPLSESDRFWNSAEKFDLIIGNPPFLKAITGKLPYISKYNNVLSGQPNLYQLFLWWAIKAIKPGGNISYIVPLSIKSGRYLRNLRKEINGHCSITALTSFIDRKGTFKSVDQQMLAISLEKESELTSQYVEVRVSNNGKLLSGIKPILIDRKNAIWNKVSEPMWLISDKKIDYKIFSKVCKNQDFLGDAHQVNILNGGFVWNQNKANLQATQGENTAPLISAPSIDMHNFAFPSDDERVGDRQYVNLSCDLKMRRYSGSALLLKRTTPAKKAGRRIIGVVIPSVFIDRYSTYFTENHVNIIIPTINEDASILFGLSGWLNSRLANFIFSMMNGSSHLSIYELEQMPSPLDLFEEIHALSIQVLKEDNPKKSEIMEDIDEKIFDYFNLSMIEKKRITKLIPL